MRDIYWWGDVLAAAGLVLVPVAIVIGWLMLRDVALMLMTAAFLCLVASAMARMIHVFEDMKG